MTTPYRVIEGHLVATDKRFAVVVSRWNHLISDRLLEGDNFLEQRIMA